MMEAIAKRRALGRGLGALIPAEYPADPESVDVAAPTTLALSEISPNPNQPRLKFDAAAIDELTASIREKGILQPLLVRPHAGAYQLIAGERRFRAAVAAGLERVPVVVRDVADAEVLELALIENIQRENLNPMEAASAYSRLIDELHLTHQEIATRVSKDRSTIANTIRLLSLPEEIRAEIEAGNLSAGHARALAALTDDSEKIELAHDVMRRRLTVRQTEQIAKTKRRPEQDIELQACERRLTNSLGTRVRIQQRRNGAGRIEIDYYSLDQLNGLLQRFEP